jgi:hypothetical protein
VAGTDNIVYINTAPGAYLPVTDPQGNTILERTVKLVIEDTTWVVIYPTGCQWRNTPMYDNRVNGAGPTAGHQLTGKLYTGYDGIKYVQCNSNKKFLPVTTKDGAKVLQKIQNAAPAAAAPAAPPPPPKPVSEWTEVKDAQGNKYYWNKTTNATSWTKPASQQALNNDLARLSDGYATRRSI